MRTRVVTHRGLDPDKGNYFIESSREAFSDQLNRGFGLEFDVRPTRDGSFVIIHDIDLSRLSKGLDTRRISETTATEMEGLEIGGCHMITLPPLISLINKQQAEGQISALHLKGDVQERQFIQSICEEISNCDADKIILFDAKIETARLIKNLLPSISIAASVSHKYDIARYNQAVGGTLISIEEVEQSRDLFDWVWLDEWDLTDVGGGSKKLYTPENFKKFRAIGFNIALVTPELHGRSPGLVGGEAHQDARDWDTLNKRLREIVALGPDLVCTDHPDFVSSLINQ